MQKHFETEKLLLRNCFGRDFGTINSVYHFRRQHPLSNYVVDFYCEALKLVIEVDGSVHADPIVAIDDKSKEESLISYGLEVIRFTNDVVVKDVDTVVELIKNKITSIEVINNEKQ